MQRHVHFLLRREYREYTYDDIGTGYVRALKGQYKLARVPSFLSYATSPLLFHRPCRVHTAKYWRVPGTCYAIMGDHTS